MSVLVTAFGPFGGRTENASSLALEELLRRKIGIRYRILPVDSVVAPSRLKQAIRLIRPAAVIMLGEAADCRGIRLETTAWNSKDFRIPDVAGRIPEAHSVRSGASESMASTLPLNEIHAALRKKGYPVSFSDDPGRYLCNQLFFTALDFLKENDRPVPSGFIHLPLEKDFPPTQAADAIAEVIRICRPLEIRT